MARTTTEARSLGPRVEALGYTAVKNAAVISSVVARPFRLTCRNLKPVRGSWRFAAASRARRYFRTKWVLPDPHGPSIRTA